MARKTNPQNNHSGLGAFIGSLAGATALGGVTRAIAGEGSGATAVASLAGSIGGGAAGGYYGAKSDRQKRGAAGGAIGGVFGPLGAALGGYIGGRKADSRRKKNPTPAMIAGAVVAGVAAVGVGYGAYRYTKRDKALKSGEVDETEALQGVIGNSSLEEAPDLVAAIQQPILLRQVPNDINVDDEFEKVAQFQVKVVRPAGKTTVEQPDGVAFGSMQDLELDDHDLTLLDQDGDFSRYMPPKKAIAYLITGLSAESAALAYELALVHIVQNKVDWTGRSMEGSGPRDQATAQILTSIAPKLDWSQGLKPYTYGSKAWQVWVAVQLMGVIAYQSSVNQINFAAWGIA